MSRSRHYILYVPGLGDHTGLLFHSQRLIVQYWQVTGVRTEIFPMIWTDDSSFDARLKELLARVKTLRQQSYVVTLVGVSAGASAAINAYAQKPDYFQHIICVAGEINGVDDVGGHIYKSNPLFAQSMHKVCDSLKSLNASKRQKILSIRGSRDRSVPASHSYIPGAQHETITSWGHTHVIAMAITVHAAKLISYAKHGRYT